MSPHTAAYRLVCQHLEQLADAELQDLADQLQGLLEARAGVAPENENPHGQNGRANTAASGAKAQIAQGHIEIKTIRGCGPYKYLRYRSGGKLKSKYLGKAK